MKALSYSSMARARLRANKRGYISLSIGIFLSIFLISCMVLGIYGAYLASCQKRLDKVGNADMVVLDNDECDEQTLHALDCLGQIGNCYISGVVTDRNTYVGYYDDQALEILCIEPTEGRMPEKEGEIAIEPSAMDVLEAAWEIGDTAELSITAIDGTEQTRSYTVVGFLPERSENLVVYDRSGLSSFPAIVTSKNETPFSVGRVGTHHILTLKDGASLSDGLSALRESGLSFIYYCGFDNSGNQTDYAYASLLARLLGAQSELITLITMVCMLVIALIFSCGVGISSAMEGLLFRRREEIGVLRALGATQRQIRRMFGRENLLLALILSPVSIAISCGPVWILSVFYPQNIAFGFSVWLLAPVALFAIAVILISGYLPLRRASKLMPMSVMRDTVTLRHAKHIKSKSQFSAPKLISSRQVRFQSSRQIGASVLVGMMLLCSGLLTSVLSQYRDYTQTDRPAFLLQNASANYSGGQISLYSNPPFSDSSIAQIRRLNHVQRVTISRNMRISAIVSEVPTYALSWIFGEHTGMLTEDMLGEALKIDDSTIIASLWEEDRAEYLDLINTYNINGEAYDISLVTVELDESNLKALRNSLSSGEIDVDAINAGREVIVLAPEVWGLQMGTGSYRFWYSEEQAMQQSDGKASLWAWNNVFSIGQSLPLLQLYRTEEGGEVFRNDETVTVGAILSEPDYNLFASGGECCIITTEQGLRNMNLYCEGIQQISVYLDGEVSEEEEAALESRLSSISRRTDSYVVTNYMEIYRQAMQEDRQQILMLLSIATVFFAVAVSMIVSAVTRRLQSEGRTIGMLRAVGADERAILGCYSGQLRASILGGTLIALGIIALYILICLFNSYIDASVFVSFPVTILAIAALCWAVCRALLRVRIREIISKSIIENIKEL